jgi:hypothetical protein
VKCFAIIAVILMPVFFAPAGTSSWQDLSANLFTNAAIDWQAPADHLPKSLWIYRRLLPHVFPADVISNAVVLGSLQARGFPKPTTNDFYMPKQEPPNWPGTIPILFGIRPCDAYLYFYSPDCGPVSEKRIPDDETLVALARKCAAQLGLDPAELRQRKFYTHSCDTDRTVNNLCGRGVFFPRCLDGIAFFSASGDGEGAEGFSMEFGEHGKIQAFSVRWSEVEHYKSEPIIHQDEIVRCIRAHKAIVMPNYKDDDFARLKKLATAKKFTITKITPYYAECIFGEVPTNDVPFEFAIPFAELKLVADFGNTNANLRIVTPILSEDGSGLLKAKIK